LIYWIENKVLRVFLEVQFFEFTELKNDVEF